MKYFLHDTSSFEDEKVAELFMKYGYEGVGLFYVILEKIAFQEKPVKTKVLKNQLRIGKRLERCWTFMEEIGLINTNNGETFNKQLLNYSGKYQIKKEKNRKRVSEWRENQRDAENVTCTESVRNSPKVNKSKVKISNTILFQKNGGKDVSVKSVKISNEDVDEIYKSYPSRCPIQNRSLGKSKKDKDKIKALLKTNSKEELLKTIELYISDCTNTDAYVKNFSTFLNNLPDTESFKEQIKQSVHQTDY